MFPLMIPKHMPMEKSVTVSHIELDFFLYQENQIYGSQRLNTRWNWKEKEDVSVKEGQACIDKKLIYK